MDNLTQTKWGLSISNIREKQLGLPEQTYDIVENLDEYIDKIIKSLGITVIKVSRLGGWSSINVNLDCDDGKNYVVKIDPWKGVLVTSATFYTLVKQHYPKQRVPEVVKLDESRAIIPHEYLVLEYIEHDSVSAFSQEDKYKAGKLFGDFLKQIHTIQVGGYGSPISTTQWRFKTWSDALTSFLNSRYLSRISEIFDQGTIDYVMQLPAQAEDSKSMLLHADVSIENCLFEKSNEELSIAGIIDPDTTGGDPFWDIAIGARKDDTFSKGLVDAYWESEVDKQLNSKRFLTLSLIYLFWIIGWRQTMGMDIHEYKGEFEEKLSKLKALA